MMGPGVYDEVCARVREETGAKAVILAIIDGKHGEGFSVQGTPLIVMLLPGILRRIADDIERDTPARFRPRD